MLGPFRFHPVSPCSLAPHPFLPGDTKWTGIFAFARELETISSRPVCQYRRIDLPGRIWGAGSGLHCCIRVAARKFSNVVEMVREDREG